MQLMNRPVHVLNRNWQPINITNVAKALKLVWLGSARIVDPKTYETFSWSDWARLRPEGELYIRSAKERFGVPLVIVLTHYDRVPTQSVVFNRHNILKRDRFTCQYCGKQQSDLTLDHVVPRAQGGQTSWENCVAACYECNSKKANRTPAQAKMKLRKQPIKPAWSPAFAVSTRSISKWDDLVSAAYWNTELQE